MKKFHLICGKCGSDDVVVMDYFIYSSNPCRELTDIHLTCDKCNNTVKLSDLLIEKIEKDLSI